MSYSATVDFKKEALTAFGELRYQSTGVMGTKTKNFPFYT